jgi:MinD-like ATPase involved in chromosome partitioning or flagellar assembly
MKSVREFTVKVKAFTKEEALNKADVQAKTLTDLLAVKSAKHLGHVLTGFNRDPDPSRTVRQDSE